MKRYEKGRRFENSVKKLLEEKGWLVIRSAGSESKVDLVAIKEGVPPLIVQCKLDGNLSKFERTELIEMARQFGCVAMLALKEERKLKLRYL